MERIGHRRRLETAAWTLLLAVAVLWPGRFLAPLDGAPLNGRVEAVLIGLVLPTLWWLEPAFLSRRIAQSAIVALIGLKALAFLSMPQYGLCARFSAAAPLRGISNTIPIEEPTGFLRSFDARADWFARTPRCTAILDRPYRTAQEFPAWFLNLISVIEPKPRDVAVDVSGYVGTGRAGTLAIETGRDTTVTGRIGSLRVSATAGEAIAVALDEGVHSIELHAALKGNDWKFVPLWNGRDAWSATRFAVDAPNAWERSIAVPLAMAASAVVLVLAFVWMFSAILSIKPTAPLVLWIATAAALLVALSFVERFERLAGLPLFASAVVPLAARHRNLRGAFLLLGVPWLAFFVARSWNQIGHVTIYSPDDDWLVFQSAAYRIFLNGYWLEGGSATFYFQPLYRWIAGFLHMIFGDSSVGEVYWDAACLLIVALTTFQLVKVNAGFRAALIAAAAALSMFTTGTVWYFIGRGLSEISAAGFVALTVLLMLRARVGRRPAAVAAAVCATLAFYTRLNHLLLAILLTAFLLPLTATMRVASLRRGLEYVRYVNAGIYLGVFGLGVALFALRTWWYTGVFSVLYGTSFPVQSTGLDFSTLGSADVWARVRESVLATLWMNEPPHPDVRAVLVVGGVLASILAIAQVPGARRLPASAALLSVGGLLGAFVAHAHHYPGRFSIHLVPFTVATSVCSVALLLRRFRARSREV